MADESMLGKSGLAYFWTKLKAMFVQSDWGQSDSSQLDFVKNRPFYEYDALGDKLSWDGETYTVSCSIGNFVLAKVSDVVIKATDVANGCSFIKRTVDGDVAYKYTGSQAGGYFDANGCGVFDALVVLVPSANYTFQGLTFPEPGIYFAMDDVSYVTDFVVPGRSDFLGTYTQTLPERFLNGKLVTPGTGANAEVFNGGEPSKASGANAHAEGYDTTASGANSHAQGINARATGYASHAEGQSTLASGSSAHAEGYYTKAAGDYQHVHGKWNVEDTEDKYATIVGNGTEEADRKNAHTIDWEGNAWFAGDVYVGGTSMADAVKLGSGGSSQLVETTIPSADWTGDAAPYSLTLAVTGVTDSSNQEFLPAVGITAEQLTALQSANIQDGGQTTDSVTLMAFGVKPSVDIPVRIILRGSI